MRILFFTQSGPQGASSRTRVYQYLPYLRAQGWTCWVSPAVPDRWHRAYFFSRNILWKALFSFWIALRRFAQCARIPFADIVFIQKPLLPVGWPALEPWVAKLSRRVVFDFDDAIFLPSPFRARAVPQGAHQRRFARILSISNVVIAGNKCLAGEAARTASRIEVLPTVVDTQRFLPRARGGDSPLTIGWMGSPTTAFYLEDIKEAVVELSRKFSLRWVFAGVPALGWHSVPVTCEPWDYGTEVATLQSFDIFISPLRDTPWEQGKCGLKTLTAMSVALPVVASPVGVHKEILRDGQNGFLADGVGQWVEKLSRLVSDAPLRLRLGREARKTVQQDFDLTKTAPRLERMLKSL